MVESVIEFITDYSSHITESYGVNPFWFIAIYVLTIPIFWLSLYYTVKNYRNKKSIWLPLIGLFVSQFACYFYMIVAGRDLPYWIYVLIGLGASFGIYKAWRQLQRKARIELISELLYNEEVRKTGDLRSANSRNEKG
ncbi:MAG: hypothetical protein LAT57_10900 [Balneolales bacterium]|nr:hypothetical protein [Balneolales bacterium]